MGWRTTTTRRPAARNRAATRRVVWLLPLPVRTELIREWTFADTAGWKAWHNCTLAVESGLLKVHCTGKDPYFGQPLKTPGGSLALQLKVRANGVGGGSVYWATEQSPQMDNDKYCGFRLKHDGQWHELTVRFEVACLGFSGGPADKEAILHEILRADRVLVWTDAPIALSGATGGGPGIITICGTRSVPVTSKPASASAMACCPVPHAVSNTLTAPRSSLRLPSCSSKNGISNASLDFQLTK